MPFVRLFQTASPSLGRVSHGMRFKQSFFASFTRARESAFNHASPSTQGEAVHLQSQSFRCTSALDLQCLNPGRTSALLSNALHPGRTCTRPRSRTRAGTPPASRRGPPAPAPRTHAAPLSAGRCAPQRRGQTPPPAASPLQGASHGTCSAIQGSGVSWPTL